MASKRRGTSVTFLAALLARLKPALWRYAFVPKIRFRAVLAILPFGNPLPVIIHSQLAHKLVKQPLLVVSAVDASPLSNQFKHFLFFLGHCHSPKSRHNKAFEPTLRVGVVSSSAVLARLNFIVTYYHTHYTLDLTQQYNAHTFQY